MGYTFSLEDAKRYDEWFQKEPGESALRIQKQILHDLWSPMSRHRVLEVGCGTGVFLEWFSQQGHQVTGVDASPSMLNLARKRLPGRVVLEQGRAEILPYEDNAFDTVALITSLEFVDNPLMALQEAFRVARSHVLLGTLNKYSLVGCQRYVERILKPTIYSHARFFGVFELRRLIEIAVSGYVPVAWRTCLLFPLSTLRYLRFLERSRYLHWHPFGHFIAMRADLRYPVQAVQDPLVMELRSGMGHVRLHTSCWRFPSENPNPGVSVQPQ